MSALLESLRYDGGSVSAQAATASEDWNSEGKFGIPRFNGEPGALTKYSFRVKVRAQKESLIEESEVKKLGTLGLRLLEGLRGQTFRLAQQLDTKKLAEKDGHELLLKTFEQHLKPRKDVEARELYVAGSRDGGIFSRQPGEPMSSYVMRRKAWWHALVQLDSTIMVSEAILCGTDVAECQYERRSTTHDSDTLETWVPTPWQKSS